MVLSCRELTKSFAGRPVLDRVSFSCAPGEFLSLVGPSGVGKSTLLRILAGLERADTGTVSFARPPTAKNPVILVHQDYVLFPAMTAAANVAFGLESRRLPRAEVRRRTAELLDYFQLSAVAQSYPASLSGGQKQRVALARALAVRPEILLLDEPFANLDPNLKLETATFLRRTQREFGTTMLAATHDLDEAFAMSDRMGIMLGGRMVQFGPVADIYRHPSSLAAASFLGPVNRIPPELGPAFGLPPGERTAYARPEDLSLSPPGPQDAARTGRVAEVAFAGRHAVYRVRLAGHELIVYDMGRDLAVGDMVAVRLLRHHHFEEET